MKRGLLPLHFVARMLLCCLFFGSAFLKGLHLEWTVADFDHMKMGALTHYLVIAALIWEFVFAVLLFVGWQTRLASCALLLFVLGTNFVFHQFWAVGEDKQLTYSILFLKDLAIAAGLLMFIVYGGGYPSLDKPVSED